MKTLGHLRLTEISLKPGQEWPAPEWLDHQPAWRFLRVHAGAAYWMGAPPARALAGGELIVIAPDAKILILASQLSEVTLQGFSFAPDLLCGTFTLDEADFFGARARDTLPGVSFLPTTHPAAKSFAALARDFPQLGTLAHSAAALRVVAEVFDPAMTRSLAQARPAASAASAAERFQHIVAPMPDLELINYAPSELARLCGCSSRHFNRLFSGRFGASVRARQTELRLLRARQLLGNTDDKIGDVAIQSGYRNLSLFNSLFKRRFGVTPSEWRRNPVQETT